MLGNKRDDIDYNVCNNKDNINYNDKNVNTNNNNNNNNNLNKNEVDNKDEDTKCVNISGYNYIK